MRAITIPQPGGPDVLTLADVDEPSVGPDEVLIAVAAAGVNGADIAQRQGNYPSPAGAPAWPGLEVSGVIAQVGGNVRGFRDGDRVCALLPAGGYAERVAVNAQLVLPIPRGVDLADAAGLPEVAATVWSNVFMAAQLKPGECLLVHGGSSGIGSMAIQLAHALGSPVIATAGSEDKVAFCRSLGATGVNYRTEDFVARILEHTDGAGVDVILDMVGGDYLARNITALAVDGRIMAIANRSGATSTFSIGALMAKRGRIWGTTVRARPLGERAAIMHAVHANVWPLVEAGLVRPIIDTVFPLARAAEAHRRMESSAHMGKILLTMAQPGS